MLLCPDLERDSFMLEKYKKFTIKSKVPKRAKKVFRGLIFDVYQWPQKMFDGTVEPFEMLRRKDSAMVIGVTTDKKIIINDEQQPDTLRYFALPGGVIDKGETPLQAAKRELLEEAGYKAKEWMLWDERQVSGKIEWAAYTFIAKECEKIADIDPDPGEKIKTRLVSFDEFIDIVVRDDFRETEAKLRLLESKFNLREINKFRKLLLG